MVAILAVTPAGGQPVKQMLKFRGRRGDGGKALVYRRGPGRLAAQAGARPSQPLGIGDPSLWQGLSYMVLRKE